MRHLIFKICRFPPVLIQVECSTCAESIGCRDENGNTDSRACEKVYYHIRVLRETDEAGDNGTCIYEEGWENLSIGCTCAIRQRNN